MFVKRIWFFKLHSAVAEIQPIVSTKQSIISALSALAKSILNLCALICCIVQTQ